MIALNVGCGSAMSWIQTETNLLRTFPPEGRYLVGVSGGRDSVALLHWLVNLSYKKLIVCHLNHQLRGRSSEADGRFVQKLIARYNQELVGQAPRLRSSRTGKPNARPIKRTMAFDFELGAVNVRALATKQKMSIETAAREARYGFFAETARRRKCKTIFLAHHADDLVETFLINLFRGAGTAGLSSMREISTRRINDVEITIVRPLLSIWRSQINRYIREHRLKFREDATNKSLAPMRNRIRHLIIPYLEKTAGRNIRESIWRTAIIGAEEANWIENQSPASDQLLAAHATQNLPVKTLRSLPMAIQRRAIQNWLRAQKVSEITFDVIERVRSLADHNSVIAKVNLAQDRHARRRSGKIFIE
jgi:tRNA(Ile)-lysidine synthase